MIAKLTPEEREVTRLRIKIRQLRDALRSVLALTRGPRGTADVETLREAAALVDDAPGEGRRQG
jgi:hypothetical protein